MKFVNTKDYYGKYHKVAVSDEVYRAFQEAHNAESALQDRESYRRKRVVYSETDFLPTSCMERNMEERLIDAEADKRLYDAIFHQLTPVQRRRILMILEDDLSITDISELEHRHYSSIQESIMAALKKLRAYMSTDMEF